MQILSLYTCCQCYQYKLTLLSKFRQVISGFGNISLLQDVICSSILCHRKLRSVKELAEGQICKTEVCLCASGNLLTQLLEFFHLYFLLCQILFYQMEMSYGYGFFFYPTFNCRTELTYAWFPSSPSLLAIYIA